MTRLTWAAYLSGATIAMGLLTTAHAQQPPATGAPAATTTPATPPAKARTKGAAKEKKAEVKKTAKAPSPCHNLDQTACTGKSECTWVGAAKRKDGKEVKAYCRLKPKTTAKVTTKSAAPPKK